MVGQPLAESPRRRARDSSSTTTSCVGKPQPKARFLASGSPAGFENFFPDIEATARPLPYGSPEFLAELAKVYTKYDSELLGPPPEG